MFQLTAQQNLTFIEPFCKTLAKTKEYDITLLICVLMCSCSRSFSLSLPLCVCSRVMLKAIGSNIFNSIVDQVPYAIEDLLREIEESGPEPMNHTDDDGRLITQALQ